MNANIDISGVVLNTARLTLRQFEMSDLEAFYAYASVPGVGEWAGWEPHESIAVSRSVLEMFVADRKTFAITLRGGGLIGSIGIETLRHEIPAALEAYRGRELGYALARTAWGNGYATEAVLAVIDYCFRSAGLDFLTCNHFVENDRSRRVIEKSGFAYVGSIRLRTQSGAARDGRAYIRMNPARFSRIPPLK